MVTPCSSTRSGEEAGGEPIHDNLYGANLATLEVGGGSTTKLVVFGRKVVRFQPHSTGEAAPY